jgi:cyclohexyl-isocyanide hydratase
MPFSPQKTMSIIDHVTRRGFVRALTAMSGAVACASVSRTILAVSPENSQRAGQPMCKCDSVMKPGTETILILIYPGFTSLDAIAPQHVFSSMIGAKVKFVAKTLDPVRCEGGFEIIPQLTFDQCPDSPTLLMVPGGSMGTLEAINDRPTVDFIRRVGGRASMVGSVCTGSLLLGVAGLLKGYHATCHWQLLELLPLVGAIPSTKRVVFDRNRVTGAGVTAGLDFALELVKYYRGDFYAQCVELLSQYDPQPPFPKGGDPATADPAVVSFLNEMHQPFVARTAEAIRKAEQEQGHGS